MIRVGSDDHACSRRSFERAIEQSPVEPSGRIVLGSPQSIPFYLGELTRPGGQVIVRRGEATRPPEERRLFVVTEQGECGQGAISTNYAGTVFVIPQGTGTCHPGRSLQSLSCRPSCPPCSSRHETCRWANGPDRRSVAGDLRSPGPAAASRFTPDRRTSRDS